MKIYSSLCISEAYRRIMWLFTILALCVGLDSHMIGAAEEAGSAAEAHIHLVKLNSGESEQYFNCDIMGDYKIFKNDTEIATLSLGHHGNVHFPHELHPLGFLDGSWVDFNVSFEYRYEEKGSLEKIMKDVTTGIGTFIERFLGKKHLMVGGYSPALFQGFRGLMNAGENNVPKVLAAQKAGWSVSDLLPTGGLTGEAWIIQYPPLTEEENQRLTTLVDQLTEEEEQIIRRRRELLDVSGD